MKCSPFVLLMTAWLAFLVGPAIVRGQAVSDDDRAVRVVAERFFQAYAEKNLSALMALWSQTSPEAAQRRQTMQQLFAETGPIETKSLEIVRAAVEGDVARVLVRAELTGNDLGTLKPHKFLGKLVRTIELAREADSWKVRRYGPTERFVAERLAAAATPEVRQRVLGDEKDFVNKDLVFAMLMLSNDQSSRRQWAEARRLIQLGLEIAQRLDDPAALGECHLKSGRLFEDQEQFAAALDEFRKARGLFHSLPDTLMEGRMQYNMAGMLRQLQRGDEAISAYEEALRLCREAKDQFGQAGILNNLGLAYEDAGKLAEARQAFESAVEVKRALGDPRAVALSLVNLARTYGLTDKHAEAVDALVAAREIYRQAGEKHREAEALLALGWEYHALARYPEELKTCDDALVIAREIKDVQQEIHAISQRGLVHENLGRYAEARVDFETCLRLAQAAGLRGSEGSALHNLGNAQAALGQRQQSFESYSAALKIAVELGDTILEADALGNIANYYTDEGQYDQALNTHEKLLASASAAGQRQREAITLNNMAVIYSLTGHYPEAMRAYEAALKIDRALGDRRGEAHRLAGLSDAYSHLGQYAQAMQLCQASLKINREIGDRASEAHSWRLLGNEHQHAAQYGEGLAALEQALRIDRELGLKQGEVADLIDLGTLYQHIGRYADALASLEPALRTAREMGLKKDETHALRHIGHTYLFTRDFDKSLAAHRAAREIAQATGNKEAESNALLGIGQALNQLDRHAEALEAFDSGLALVREMRLKTFEAYFLSNAGIAYTDLGKFSEALSRLEQASRIADEHDDTLLLALVHLQIGSVYSEQKQWSDAAQAYRRGIENLESVRTGARERSLQTSFLGKHASAYYGLARALVELEQPTETFAVSERAKARTLVDMIQSGRGDIRQSMSDEERREEDRLEAEIATYGAQAETDQSGAPPQRLQEIRAHLEHARTEYDAFRRRLYLAHPALETERAAFEPATLTALNQGLFAREPGLCVLSYLANQTQTLLFVLTQGPQADGPASLVVHRLPGLKGELKTALENFRAACQNPGARASADGERLYRELLAPAGQQLAGKKQLVVIPDGLLHSVPFHAFQDAEGKYVLERHSVSYAPSVTALLKIVEFRDRRAARAHAGSPIELLAVGRPAFGPGLSDLPATADEVVRIAELFGPGARVLMGKEATEMAVKALMVQSRYVHFATHGLLNEAAPLYSAIALAKGEQDDGRLEARELLDLSLQADLTVLSACQTALGQEVGGEGVLGLTWSLFAAGSPSSVVTLWSVPDQATSSLMVEFYRRLRTTPAPTKAEALRQAQLWLLREAPQRPGLVRGLETVASDVPSAPSEGRLPPYFWAAFVLSGDWR